MATTKARKGFRVPRREALVEFEEGHEYHGAEVRLRLDVPMGLVFEFQRLGSDGEAALRRFGDQILLGWNLEDDDGEPVPATADGLLTQPFGFANTLMTRWAEAVTGVPGPLGVPSSNGATSAASKPPRDLGL